MQVMRQIKGSARLLGRWWLWLRPNATVARMGERDRRREACGVNLSGRPGTDTRYTVAHPKNTGGLLMAVKIGLVGTGTVGGGCIDIIQKHRDDFKRIASRSTTRFK